MISAREVAVIAREVMVTAKGVVVIAVALKEVLVIVKEEEAIAEEAVVSTLNPNKRKRKSNTKSETIRTGGRREMTSTALKRSLIRRNNLIKENSHQRKDIIIRNNTRTKRNTSQRVIDPMTVAKVAREVVEVVEAKEVAEHNSKKASHSVSLQSTNRWKKKLSKSLLIDSQQWTAMTDYHIFNPY
jgi:hypothetical protein